MGINHQTRAADDGAQRVRADQFRANHRALPLRWANFAQPAGLLALLLALLAFAAPALHAQSTYQITSATYGSSGLAVVPAGVNGATLTLTGTLPTAAQQAASPLLGCFYTGYGSTAGFALSPPSSQTTEPLNVPASTIQSIPQSQFTAANGYSVVALVYFIASGSVCDGTFNANLTNQLAVQVAAPYLGSYTGPTSVPQTNPSTNLQAAPLSLNIPAGGFLPSSTQGGATTVTFGSFGSVSLAIPATATSSINVPVPAAFSSSPVGTAASLTICNTFTGAANPVCTTPTPAITLTVTALAASTGTVTASPNPVLTSGQTVLTAQFQKAASAGNAPNLGAPSGTVSFTAPGATVAPAPLILDTTAAFATQTTALTLPAAPAPVISPAAGSYTGATTITITDAVTGAAIYYTQDGTTPTSSSTLYTGPFQIISSETVKAIAVVPGYANSAAAANAYSITILPATQLAFTVQPSNTVLNTAIAPAVQVALKDVNGTTVVNSSAAVSLSLYSDPGDTSLGGTTTVNAVNGVATFSNLTVGVLGTGYSLQAQSGNLIPATSQPFNVTPPSITMTVQSELVGINSTLNGSFTLSAPAPAGGLAVSLTSGTPANVTISPASVTVAAGQSSGAFTYTGVAAGNSILSAAATGYTTGTVMTTATAAQVSLGVIPNVAPAQMQSLALSLPTAAPPGGTTVTFTIANTSIATVTQSSFVPAGAQTPSANPQVTGVLIGTTTVTANAPGYAPAVRPVVVTVTAAFNPGNTDINLATASNTSLTISAPAPPGGIAFTLSSDDPTIATVPSAVTVPAGATSVPIAITGVANGSTTIRADSPGITEATGTVNVLSNIGTSTFLAGYDLEEETGLYLPVSPSAPTTVTMTVADPTVAVISTSRTAAGQAVLTFPNTTSSYISTIWIQGLKVGSTTVDISAPGYNDGTVTVTVDPSGFAYYYTQTITTTTYSGTSNATIVPVPLNPSDLSIPSYGWFLNPQSSSLSVPVSSSNTAVGTVTSPVVFNPGDSYGTFTFTPLQAGTTNLNIGTPPAGFSVPSQYQQAVATVNTPQIVQSNMTIGAKLQTSQNLYLPEPPPSAVTVTVTSGTPGVMTISQSNTVAGTATQTFNVAAGNTFIGTVYLQGQTPGTSTLTVSANGYTSGVSTVTVLQSGFSYSRYSSLNFSTTTFSQPTTLAVYTALLNADLSVYDTTYYSTYALNPGVGPVTVPISDSAPTSVGSISPTSVVFNTGDAYQTFAFTPAGAGTANLTIGAAPAGFSTPTQEQQDTATVTAPAFSAYNPSTGVNLQTNFSVYVPQASPTPETVTVTSSNPAVAVLSASETAAGSGTLTFTTTNGSGQSVWVQGLSVGTSTITVSAPGYTPSTGTITVYPSGFLLYSVPSSTTTFSGASTIYVETALLYSSTNLNYFTTGLALNPGAGTTVAVTDNTPSVGTINSGSTAALVFAPGDAYHTFTFQPVSAGMTTLAISTPAGFSTPASNQSGTITVAAPVINLGSITTGVNLDGSLGIYLPQTPPNNNGSGVTVTVTSSSPALATLSTDPTVVGTPSVTFNNVTTTFVGTLYVQGQSLGTAQLTEKASGYTDGNSTITVLPSGFGFSYNNPTFTTTVANGPYTLTAYPFALNTGALTPESYSLSLQLNPGLGNVTVPVTSSNPAVGTTPSGPTFTPGSNSATFQFLPAGTGMSTITLGTPAGYSTPSQNGTATVTVQ